VTARNAPKDSAADAGTCHTRRARARVSTPSFFVSIAAQTHRVMLMGFRVLPIFPVVQAKTALPWFGHAQIVLPAQRIWKAAARIEQDLIAVCNRMTDRVRIPTNARTILGHWLAAEPGITDGL
jgi:hypothetical protein